MNGGIKVLSIAPGASVQDLGRPGYQRYGVSESGVMDRMAVACGAALLRQSTEHPVVELCGGAAQFQLVGQDTQLAVTGAPARVTVDDNPVQFCSSFSVADNQKVTITPLPGSVYTYLHVA
ncbi:MAG: urea amidolyase, partial [Pseudomonadota bacterium]